MPFVLSPMLWDGLSRGSRRSGGHRMRAHDDGMVVGYDTPEAFEEVAWRAFWPEKYHQDRIEPWTGEEDAGEFGEFFGNHMLKMLALRGNGAETGRYVSKTNANIASIRMLVRLFPNARIVVPVRHPLAHVGSLLRQHHNFLKLHAEDRFSRRYMESIGHFEFGEALKPIDMGGWLAAADDLSPLSADYWLAYWAATFETLLTQQTEQVVFLRYEHCCAEAKCGLGALAEVLAIEDPGPLLAQVDRFRPPTAHDPEMLDCDPACYDSTLRAYDAVLRASIVLRPGSSPMTVSGGNRR